MSTGFNSTTAAAYLQEYYAPDFVRNTITEKGSSLLKFLKKNEKAHGNKYNFLAKLTAVPTGSADFATAQSKANNGSSILAGGQFNVDYQEDNCPVRVAGKIIKQTMGTNSWANALDEAMEDGLEQAAHRLSVALYGEGWGELFQVDAISGATFKPKETSQIYRVREGDVLVFSSSKNAATLRDSGASLTVTGVNYTTNVITCSANLSTISGLVDDDWVFNKGDRQNAASPSRLRPVGLPGWHPLQAVSDSNLTTLFGVDRSVNSRYYGHDLDATGLSIEEAFVRAAVHAKNVGHAKKLVGVLSVAQFANLLTELGSSRRYNDTKGTFGFGELMVVAPGIQVPIICDQYCDDARSYLVDVEHFKLVSMGPSVYIDNFDSNKILRISDDNGFEVRITGYQAFTSENPAANVVIEMPAV